jgi:hypothetical protein
MRNATGFCLYPAIAALAAGAFAQSEERAPAPDDSASTVAAPVSPWSQRALGTLLQGPIDCSGSIYGAFPPPSGGTAWNRLLGCESAWGYYWVTGSDNTAVDFYIHQFDATTGAYIQSFLQDITGSGTVWGQRDLASDEPNYKLWGGQESRRLKEYTFTPPPGGGPNGTLAYTTTYTIPIGGTFTSAATIRALTRDASTGHFFTKNFNTARWEFTLTPTPAYVGEVAGNGKATYGLATDTLNGTMWQFDQFPLTGYDAVEGNEVDAAGLLTGRTFVGVTYGVTTTNIAGGCDFVDLGGGNTALLCLHQNTSDELYLYELDTAPACTTLDICEPSAPDVTDGCTPDVSWTGTPDVTQCNTVGASDFVVTFGSMAENKSCSVVIGKGAPVTIAWSAQSDRCFPSPYSRTGQGDTGGTGAGCTGSISLDVENYLQGGNPLLTPAAAGDDYVVQTWYRDPVSAKTTQMTDAAHFTVCP